MTADEAVEAARLAAIDLYTTATEGARLRYEAALMDLVDVWLDDAGLHLPAGRPR